MTDASIGAALLEKVKAVRQRLLAGEGDAAARIARPTDTRVCLRVRPVLEHEHMLLGQLIPGRSDKSFAQIEYEAVVVPPRSAGEAPSHLYVLSDEKHLGVATGGIVAHPHVAHAVYGPEDGEEELVQGELNSLIECATAGGDATLLAYGQTSAGKTHSCVALQAAAARALFASRKDAASGILLSFYELAGEKIRDLLPESTPANGEEGDEDKVVSVSERLHGESRGTKSDPLLREAADGQVVVSGVGVRCVTSEMELLKLLREANAARMTAPTMRNSCSSRSHAFCIISIPTAPDPTKDEQTPDPDCYSSVAPSGVGVLRIVDLAGSERWSDMYRHGIERLYELKENNHSLSCLKECVRMRAMPLLRPGAPPPHVPYRRSTLTRLLKPALVASPAASSAEGGSPLSRRVCFLAHISPLRSAGLHTANCLEVCLQLIAGTSSAETAQRATFSAVERWTPQQVIEWVSSLEGGVYKPFAVPCFGGMSGKQLATEWLGHVIKRVAAEGGTEEQATKIYDAFHSLIQQEKAASARRARREVRAPNDNARQASSSSGKGARSHFSRPKGGTPRPPSPEFEIIVSGPPPSRKEVEAEAAAAAEHNRITAERLRRQRADEGLPTSPLGTISTSEGDDGVSAASPAPKALCDEVGMVSPSAPKAGAFASADNASLHREADAIVGRATRLLSALCAGAKVDASHGVDHALAVLRHADAALASAAGEQASQGAKAAGATPLEPISEAPPRTRREILPSFSPSRALAIRLAALLHDADDRKLFPSADAEELPNARRIAVESGASRFGPSVLPEMTQMIQLVSCSRNGNSAPPEAIAAPELLWPRWADRLEATGEVGVVRCYQYNRSINAPLSVDSTPRPSTEADVWALATEERFQEYQARGGSSVSMMDHYYDKLLQVSKPPAHLVLNKYLEDAATERAAPLVDICLTFSRTGEVPVQLLEEMEHKQAALS